MKVRKNVERLGNKMTIKMTKLAKIYYQNREVKYLGIYLSYEYHSDESRSVYIGPSTHISGKHDIITVDYHVTEHKDDKEKEFSLIQWEIKDSSDKVKVKHDSVGIMIEWISKGGVKSSLFIPMARIDHITVDGPNSERDDEVPKGVIEK
jgi:hypothetical protein